MYLKIKKKSFHSTITCNLDLWFRFLWSYFSVWNGSREWSLELKADISSLKRPCTVWSWILFFFFMSVCARVCVCACAVFSHVWLFATPWTVAHQVLLSMKFSRQEYWSGLPFPPPGDLPNSGIEPVSPALAGGVFFKKKKKKNCFIFGWAVSSLLHRLFSSCSKWVLHSSCDVQASHCWGFSCCRTQALGTRATSVVVTHRLSSCSSRLRSTGSEVVAHGLSCSPACGIFLDQGLNPHLLHWQVDSLLLSHLGSPLAIIYLFPKPFFTFICPTSHVGSWFRHQKLNWHPLHWKLRVLITGPPEESLDSVICLFGSFGQSFLCLGLLICKTGIISGSTSLSYCVMYLLL